jgi:hypothetical protein
MQKVAQGVDMVMSQLLPCFATEREFTEEYFVVDQMTREAEREQKQSGAKVHVCYCNNIAMFFWLCMKRISMVADIVRRPATGCVSYMLLNDEADGRRLKGRGGAFRSRTKKSTPRSALFLRFAYHLLVLDVVWVLVITFRIFSCRASSHGATMASCSTGCLGTCRS